MGGGSAALRQDSAVFIPSLHAQPMVMARGEVTVMVEPYAENVVRVSISTSKESATDAAGLQVVSAKARAAGWGPPYRALAGMASDPRA